MPYSALASGPYAPAAEPPTSSREQTDASRFFSPAFQGINMTTLQERNAAIFEAGGRMHFGMAAFGHAETVFRGAQLYDAGIRHPLHLGVHRPSPAPPPTHVVLAAKLIQEFIGPALKRREPEAFRAFWQKQLVPFRRLFHAYGVALETASETALVQDAESEGETMSFAFIRAARSLAGALGEEYGRSAYLDLSIASETIERFDDVAPRSAEEDGKQATRHNVGWMLHVAYGLSIVHATEEGLDLPSEMIAELVMGLNGYANMAFSAAQEGAALRGLSVEVPAALVEQVWGRPCEAMFTYLARRAPDQLGKYLEDRSLNAGLRARAAVAAKWIDDSSLAVPMLLRGLRDPAIIVQEGSVYGLEKHLTPEVVKQLRERMAEPDVDEAIREAIQDALDLS